MTGSAKDWPWADLRARYFPAETDEESIRRLKEWSRNTNIGADIFPDWRRTKGPKIRVVVFDPRRRPPIRKR